MNIIFLVNDATEVQPSQTTAMLIRSAWSLGHRVGVVGVVDLSCQSDGKVWGQVRWLKPQATTNQDITVLMQTLALTSPQASILENADLLMLRTNPARDWERAAAHQLSINLARRCQDNGVRVVNQPDGLIRAANKLYLLELPEFTRPKTLVSQNREEIRQFIASLETSAVLKPLQGTRGNDVFFVSSVQDSNLNQIIDVIHRQGAVMAQSCIPGAEWGDTRVVVFQGNLLELNGEAAAIQRVPNAGDFRSNLHAGGQAKPGIVTNAMRQVIVAIGPKLMRDGLELVGLDFIGSQLVEVNVFSTGGFRDAERFTGECFSDLVMASLTGH